MPLITLKHFYRPQTKLREVVSSEVFVCPQGRGGGPSWGFSPEGGFHPGGCCEGVAMKGGFCEWGSSRGMP